MGIYLILCTESLIIDDFSEFIRNFSEIQIAGILFGCNDDVVTLGERCPVEPEKFPDKSFGPVSLDSVSRLLTDRDPQSRDTQPVLFNLY